MNIEQIFEDLETEFDAALNGERNHQPLGVQRLSANYAGAKFTLDRPTLGDTYVCGIVSGRAIWRFQPYRTMGMAKVTFSTETIGSEVQEAGTLLAESLEGRFVRYSLAGDGQQIRRGRVMSVLNGLVLFGAKAEVIAVAIDRLAWLEVHAADN